MTFRVEIEGGAEDPAKKAKTEKALGKAFKDFIGVTVDIMGLKLGGASKKHEKDKKSD